MRKKDIENLIMDMKEEKITIEEVMTVKNGVECRAFRIDRADDPVSPIVYYSENETVGEIADRIRNIARAEYPDLAPGRLTDKGYVLSHTHIGLQKESEEEGFLKRSYLNVEVFLQVDLDLDDEIASAKVTPEMAHCLGLSEDDLWNAAIRNDRDLYSVHSMSELLGLPEGIGADMFVVTSSRRFNGAAALYFPEVFRDFCIGRGEDVCYILPSSTEEVIVLPASSVEDVPDIRCLAELVQQVNDEQVDPLIQLEPAVYEYAVSTNEIEVAATLQMR